MKSIFAGFVCRVLTVSMIVLPLQAQAGVIGTDQAVTAAQQRGAQATVARYLSRDEVAAQLELMGVSRQAASERVAALSDAELADLAGRIEALPAGGAASILPVVVLLVLFYYLIIKPTTAEAKEPAKGSPKAPAPAAKPAPAPEKK